MNIRLSSEFYINRKLKALTTFVSDEHYFTKLVCYIHSNPQKHILIDDLREWEWSSYQTILSKKKTKLQREKVLDWFGGELEYLKFHAEVRNF